MPLTRFEKALPDAMTIEDAIRAMIEGDGRIKLPLCYETIIGFPVLEHLAECCLILERRYDSALEYGTKESQEIAQKQLEDMETIQRHAQLYLEDLNNLADAKAPGFSPDADLPEDGSLIPYDRSVLRSALVPWAYKTHGVDIHGFHARQAQPGNGSDQSVQKGRSIPDRSPPTMSEPRDRAKLNMASAEHLRRAVLGIDNAERNEYSEGRRLFLSLAWLLEKILTGKNADWRKIVTDETDKTSTGFFTNGKLKYSKIVRPIALQLPVDPNTKDPAKTIDGHIKLLLDYLMNPDNILEFSGKQTPMAYRTLYGLARATWKAKTGKLSPERQTVEYPPDTLDVLAEGLNEATFLTPGVLKTTLSTAVDNTKRQYPPSSR
jgi:hypothetical protein